MPPDAAAALRWGLGLLILILALAAWWLARAVFRYERTGKAPPGEEIRESVFSWSDLRAAWRAWFKQRTRPRTRAATGPAFDRGPAGAVRRAYAEFLGIAALSGSPRPQDQTPIEFAGAIAAAKPATAAAVRVLAAVYSRVRYGLEVPSDEDLQAVRTALAQIRTAPLRGGESPAMRLTPGH